jgi:hypothetical protein
MHTQAAEAGFMQEQDNDFGFVDEKLENHT